MPLPLVPFIEGPNCVLRSFTRQACLLVCLCLAAALPVRAEDKTLQLTTAEKFIEAFYSFNANRLAPYLVHAGDSAQSITRYQAWAQGGNYKIVTRFPCKEDSNSQTIICRITVQDDLVQALQTGFDVTDSFHLTFTNNHITSIETSSNDQPVYYEAKRWVAEQYPGLMQGVCAEKAPSPAECARAMALGYRAFFKHHQSAK